MGVAATPRTQPIASSMMVGHNRYMARIDLTNENWDDFPPITDEDQNIPVSLQLGLTFNFTATTDINAASEEVQFSVLSAVQEQAPFHFEMLAVSVQETLRLEAEDEYQQFTGTVKAELAVPVGPGEQAEELRQQAYSQITGVEYKDDSGLCRVILLYTDDQVDEL